MTLPVRYFDTEGTGFCPERGDRLVEIAILDGDGKVLLSTLINPGRLIPRKAIEVHHITDAMVRGAPHWAQVAPQVEALIRGCELVGHNTPFDLRFLGPLRAAPAKVTCTLALARQAAIDGSKKLGDLASLAGHVAVGDYHRAAADALATRTVHRWLLQRIAAHGKPITRRLG